MKRSKHFSISVIFLILILCLSFTNASTVLADEGTPTEPPPQGEIESPTEEPTEDTSAPAEIVATPAPAEPEVETLLAQLPENTDVIVVGEDGDAVSLASQEAADAVQEIDPMWCPESETLDSSLCRKFTGGGSVQALIQDMRNDPVSYSAHGIIYFTQTVNESFILSDSDTSLGGAYATLRQYNLTLQGGWNGLTNTPSLSGQTIFNGANIAIGTSSNPWGGAVTINNVTVENVTSPTDPSLAVNSSGNVEMNDVVVTGSGPGQDGISITAANTELNNVTASNSDMNGISITAAGSGGTVTLNNVVATDNGHMEGSVAYGSGVYIAGQSTLVTVTGGEYTNNARYGIEAVGSTSTTLPVGNVWTDEDDYSPGSVVTISGDANSLNGNNVGFVPGETVHVEVVGPNGYTATCEAVADAYGNWTCQITLWPNELAVGSYSYVATGLTSGALVISTFTDAAPSLQVTVTGTGTGSVTSNDGFINCPGTCSHTYNSNPTVTLTASANPGSAFTGWGGNCSGTSPCSIHLTGNQSFAVTATFNSTKTTPVITFAPAPNPTYLGGNFIVSATTTNTDDSTLVYSQVSGPCALVSGSTFSSSGAGTCVVQASGAETVNFNAASAQQSITIAKANPVITFGAPPSPTYPGGNFTVNASTTNTDSATLNYSQVSGPCSLVSGSTFSPSGVGTCVVQASGAATTNFNAASAQQSITISSSNTAPTLNLPGNMSVEATNSSGALVNFTVTATDVEDNPDPTPTCNPASGTTFPLGTTTVNCSATDTGGLTTTGSFTVTVQDTVAPIITFVSRSPANGNGWNNTDVVVTWSCADTGSGAVSAAVTQTLSSNGANQFATGTCTDLAGNTASNTQTGINIDKTAPVLTLPASFAVEATSSFGAIVNYSASVTDNLDASVTVTCVPASDTVFSLGTTTVNCSSTDQAGNTSAASFNVTVQDTTGPIIAPHGDLFIETSNSAGITIPYLVPTTTDVVDGTGVATCTPPSGSTFPVGNSTVMCTAADTHGNAATPATFVVHVTLRGTSGGGTPDDGGSNAGNGGAGPTPNLFIPVTGPNTFKLDCIPPNSFVVQTEGARIIFNKLCGYDAFVEGIEPASLPSKMPTGASFLHGFTVEIMQNGQSVSPLPQSAEIVIEFDIPAVQQGKKLAALIWDGNQWVELPGKKTSGGDFKISSTEDGIFIFVRK